MTCISKKKYYTPLILTNTYKEILSQQQNIYQVINWMEIRNPKEEVFPVNVCMQ